MTDAQQLEILEYNDLALLLNTERPEHSRVLPPLEPGSLWFDWVRQVTFMQVEAVLRLYEVTHDALLEWEAAASTHEPMEHIVGREKYQEVLAGYMTVANLLWAFRPLKDGE